MAGAGVFWHVDDELELRLVHTGDAAPLFALVDGNRLHLREWLPWVDATRGEADTARFVASSQQLFAEGKEAVAAIWHRGTLVGVIGLHAIDPAARPFIGYWIAQDAQGKGIVTRAVRAMLDYAFSDRGLERVEIRCAAGNTRSQAVPLRLGFAREETIKNAERLHDRYEDAIVFVMQRSDWLASRRGPS